MNTAGTFDYSFLAPQAAEIRGLESTSTLTIIRMGNLLQFAKDCLEYGQFEDWVERETPISKRTAQRHLAVAKLASGRSDIVSLLPPSTVRMLAAKATPPEIVESVLAHAASGNILSESVVKGMISDDRDAKRHAKREAEAEARRAKAKSTRAKKAAEKEVWRAEQEQKRLAVRAQAQSIIDRFPPEDVSFLAGTLASDAYDVCDEFLKLIKGDTA
jgi:hypothetical protein